MGKLELFKEFVKKNPKLLQYVKNNEKTWQQFYEMYDLYGEEETTWKDYLTPPIKEVAATSTILGVNDILNWVKNLNLDNVQSGVNNIQKILGVVEGFSSKEEPVKETGYRPRPLYKHLDD